MKEEETTEIFDIEDGKELQPNEDTKDVTENKKDLEKKNKKSLGQKFKDMPKKKKIIIVGVLLLVIAIIAVLVYFILRKDKVSDNKVEETAVENQNYRYQNGTLYFYDKDKNEIGTYECKNKSEDKCYLAYYSIDPDVDNTRYVYEDGTDVLFQTPIVSNKYVFVYDNSDEKDEVIRLYDFKEQKQEAIYQEVKKANDDYTFILKDSAGKYGIINLKDGNKGLVDFKYDYLGYYDDSKVDSFIAYNNDKYIIIDGNNNEKSRPIKEKIAGYNPNFIKVKDNSKYYVYNYDGVRKISSSYDYVSFLNEYILVVKNNMLYLLDKDGNNLNIDGLKLYNDSYRRTYLYDQNKKLLKIVNSFEVSIEENDIKIDIYNGEDKESHVINALEASVNSKSENISYIDGKLYFYSDIEKTKKIGSYACKNKNSITSVDSGLTNCYLAKQSNDIYMPIINNRYVFINDTLDSAKQSIVLYDLKDNKSLSNYLEILSTYSGEERLLSIDNLPVIALSAKKNKYGMIKITTDSVSSMIDFSNQKIEQLNGNYLVNKSSGTYLIYDANGQALTSEFADEIVSYNQTLNVVMTITNDKYNLYKADGNILTSKAYERIDVYQYYLVGIDNKRLDVLNYEGKPYCQKCSDIELYTTDYSSAYKIDAEKVSIYNGASIENEINFKGEENGEE